MKTYTYPSLSALAKIASISQRGVSFAAADLKAVRKILSRIQKEDDAALVEYIRKFDSPDFEIDNLVASPKEMEKALNSLDPAFEGALDKAIANIKAFHERQKQNSWITMDRPGVLLGQIVRPVDAAAVYVPGGKGGNTPLVSSVLMGVIPAIIAGVEKICIATPPRPDGSVHPYLLAAAAKLGVHTVYKMGSAWAIAALAYGTKSVHKVDVIVGPGNIFVTIAKKLVAGTVGIDMIAGPSEVLVIADSSADPHFVAADLLSQAEHDPLSASILVTPSRSVAQKVKKAVAIELEHLERREIAEKSLKKNSAIFLVPDLDSAALVANKLAPEHLELAVADPFALLPKIRHAGAIFLGLHTPEPVGDYIAGPNHVLPTAGTARFSSALSVEHFTKKSSLLSYSADAFAKDAKDIMLLANTESLTAHARSISVRMEKEK